MHGKLTLISAPAGFGKTTLAVEWLRTSRNAVTWLSLDEADNDPARFLNYFIAALDVFDEQVCKKTRLLLQEPQPPPQDLLMTTLLNELTAISIPFVIAIDDYHFIQTLSIHQLLHFIVEYQPPQMHLVLLTREDPPLPLPRLRARGQLTEIRQVDLRFTAQESAEFLENVMGLEISKKDHSALEQRMEGWVAGLQLVALSMLGRDNLQLFVQDFTASNRYVLDYLTQEVFERQTRDIQDFLLKTSILDRLCGSLCDAITERSGSQELLANLERANLFILPLDQSRIWYRYHRLFRDMLHSRQGIQDSSTLEALHRRASLWFENHQLLPDAIQHALACADWVRALGLMHTSGEAMLKHGEIFTLLTWYKQIPDDLVQGDAEACLDYSWALMLSGQFERAAFYLSHAEEYAREVPSFLGQIFNAQAYLARAQGDHKRMVELSQQALVLLSEDDLNSRCMSATNLVIAYWHSGKMDAAERALAEVLETGKVTENVYAVSSALVFQGMVMAVRGKLREAKDRFRAIIRQEDHPAFFRGLAHLYLGVLYYEWNELEQSGKYLLEAIEIGESIQNDELLVVSWMMMARIHMASDHLAAAGDVLNKAYQKALEGDAPATTIPRLAAVRVQLAIAFDDLNAASAWGEHLVEDCDWHNFYRFTNTTRALLLSAQNKNQAAAEHLEHCYEQASREGWVYSRIVVRSLQALIAKEQEAALKYLQDALEWAQPEGFMRTFVDLGKGLEPLLQTAIQRRVVPDYAKDILSAIQASNQKPILGQLSLVEPLNPREIEVLRLLAAGLTNREIANALFISTGTAKTHVHNICGKLEVRNRVEAAARAHELGFV